ncbi:hypothetical protein E6C70_11220 [Glaciibacter flavus]|uniref:Bacterial Ig-like domain-containing protein n=1 Tax=Orlajensenia flava TaxID=2565934 RepID=A0A4S4FWH1_9MICO|nr:hypothetical protein E6C70_11220 [Glaciibacter flavus]
MFDGSISTALTSGDGSIQVFWITDLTLNVVPPPLVVTASESPHPLDVTVTNGTQDSFPPPTGFVSWSSTEPSDQFTDAGVIMTKADNRTLSVWWNGNPSTTQTFSVEVAPGPAVGLAILNTPTTATAGEQVTINVAGVDAFGNPFGDASSEATYTSNVPSDTFDASSPNLVTMTALGEHIITASYGELMPATITITVTAASVVDPPDDNGAQPGAGSTGSPPSDRAQKSAAAQLARTGTTIPVGFIAVGLLALGGGMISLLIHQRRKRSKAHTTPR